MSNSSIWPIDRSLLGVTTPGQSRPGSDDNEEVLYIPQNFKSGASLSDSFVLYPGYSLLGEGLTLLGDAIGVFCKPSFSLGNKTKSNCAH